MAKHSDKKISAYNKEVLKKQYIQTVIGIVFFLVVRCLFRRSSLKPKHIYGFLAVQILSAFCVFLMRKMCIVKGANPSVKYSGVNFLDSTHVVSYLFDIIFICRFVTYTTSFSEFYYWFLLVIPLYAIYKLISKIIYPMLKNSSAPAEEEPALSKTQQKKQARKEKIKYAH
ncbi:hypothetical protein BCR32DRAFT_242621 [Anaeromyces robustus]|uniref:DUF788-domain-containing protein n=1 Tax=Anaeromyces robustus TaxID=1754192 RepID=A0A1Y1XF23_9FUNG|nr:hypothetical protein BCR32DRAFT_242621 [Anaeromyces robustus]|eukprot:ORX84381.1 hypothetical protein BCR32DRAFT_242621 [Anaeromyces robustus]